MKLELKNSTTYSSSVVEDRARQLTNYVQGLGQVAADNNYEAAEASINLPVDDELLSVVEELVAQKVSPKLRYIFVTGIGGSNLGTKAVYDALVGYGDVLSANHPKMIFVDTNNSTMLRFYVEELIPTIKEVEEFLVVSISKSGGTTETMANTEIILSALNKKFTDAEERTVVITDEGSLLWQGAGKAGLAKLAIPKMVGGRYSVLSAVGLFPLLAAGLDIRALRRGAADMRAKCISSEMVENPALLSAAFLSLAHDDGKSIHDTFLFNSELESLGKWYRQLLGESIGKEFNLAGEKVNTGLTPTVSIGSTDLHSVGQLYLGGPKDKVTTFVYNQNTDKQLSVPADRMFGEIATMINGKTTDEIVEAILEGVKIAYTQNDLPFMEIKLEGINEYEIGAFMQFKMLEVMYLGQLFNVNAFDQPNVESYKVETKRILEDS
ncbi:MAG: hypothetical protein H6779_02450 [Candidatus Nomurabacteria bacterium]|nr:hypothetical protein [Candidatus Nomurabacteria bacterium]USN88283.1 MAG: hypothetical protein H6779_02450 [Candidatus Nomurabacteria bacterium]